MDSSPNTYLFVNKTQSSRLLSRTEGAEKAVVQSHSQQARRSREVKAAAVDQPWTLFVGHGINPGGGAAAQQRSRPPRMAPSYMDSPVTSPLPALETHYQRDVQDVGNQPHICSPSRNSSDPFNCTIAASDISHYHHVILKFISGQSSKVTFFAEAWAPAKIQRQPLPMRHDVAVASRLSDCIQDKALMYSTLAYGASLLGWMGGVSDTCKPVEYFTAQAINAIVERITLSSTATDSKPDSPLALSIYSLAISELWKNLPHMQNRGAATPALCWVSQPQRTATTSRIHLQALLKLVSSCGGWKAFDFYVLESAVLVDKYLACWEWTTPTIDIDSLPADHSLPIPEIDIKTVVLGSRLLSMNLDPRIRVSVENIIRYVFYAEQAWILAPLPFDVQSSLFFQLQRLIYELLSISNLDPVDECVRVSALIFLQANMLYRGAHICADVLAAQLRVALLSARFWDETFDRGLRFWCLFSALLTTEPSPDKAWFKAMLARYLNDIVISSSLLRDARMCLERHLYLDKRQGNQLVNIIKQLGAI